MCLAAEPGPSSYDTCKDRRSFIDPSSNLFIGNGREVGDRQRTVCHSPHSFTAAGSVVLSIYAAAMPAALLHKAPLRELGGEGVHNWLQKSNAKSAFLPGCPRISLLKTGIGDLQHSRCSRTITPTCPANKANGKKKEAQIVIKFCSGEESAQVFHQ